MAIEMVTCILIVLLQYVGGRKYHFCGLISFSDTVGRFTVFGEKDAKIIHLKIIFMLTSYVSA